MGRRASLALASILAVVGSLVLGACSGVPSCEAVPSGGCTRVLFIGNSYTFVNDLPGTYRQLAGSGNRRVEVGMIATGGATLANAAADQRTLDSIAGGDWDVVVLQEQSQIPAAPDSRRWGMYPAARTLVAAVGAAGARPILFETWAHRDGWPERGLTDYWQMQVAIEQGYLGIANELGFSVAPVGEAWWDVRLAHEEIELWQSDGTHPSAAGTYLAACVFYRTIFGASAEGLSYRSGLPEDQARVLQAAADAAPFPRTR